MTFHEDLWLRKHTQINKQIKKENRTYMHTHKSLLSARGGVMNAVLFLRSIFKHFGKKKRLNMVHQQRPRISPSACQENGKCVDNSTRLNLLSRPHIRRVSWLSASCPRPYRTQYPVLPLSRRRLLAGILMCRTRRAELHPDSFWGESSCM